MKTEAEKIELATKFLQSKGFIVSKRGPRIEPSAFLRMEQICAPHGIIPVALSTLYLWMQQGKFPRPVKLGDNAAAWRRDEIEAWIASRPRHSSEDA